MLCALHAPEMAPSPNPLRAVNLRKTLLSFCMSITHYFLTMYYMSICFIVYCLSSPLGCKHLEVMEFIINSPVHTQGQEIILKIIADYRIMGSRALCFLTSFPPSSKDSMECSKLLTAAIFYSHRGENREPGMFSVSLRPQSQLMAGTLEHCS